MKNTGIVRRIDQLGRIVIPKELRAVMNFKEGEQLEIYTCDAGELMLKRFCATALHQQLLATLCKQLSIATRHLVGICDRRAFLSASGENKNLLTQGLISDSLERILNSRRPLLLRDASITLSDNLPAQILQQYILPIVSGGDLFGGLVMQGDTISDIDVAMCDLACQFLTMLLEQ